jgi:uncharacterized protein with HEPN domain
MPRNYLLYLEDILASINKIRKFSHGYSLDEIIDDDMRLDAIIRNFEIIGIASKNMPDKIQEKYPMIEWRKIADFRNLLAHEYFGISHKILWDIINNKLPILQSQIMTVLEKETHATLAG